MVGLDSAGLQGSSTEPGPMVRLATVALAALALEDRRRRGLRAVHLATEAPPLLESLEMALRWNLDRPEAADAITRAVSSALDKGARTGDFGGEMSTSQMGDAILAEL